MATVPSTTAKHLPSLADAFQPREMQMPVPLPPIDSRFPCFGNEPADADYRRPGPSADDDVMRCINRDWTDGDSRCQSLTAFIYPHLLVI
jgi:hypothetical protein